MTWKQWLALILVVMFLVFYPHTAAHIVTTTLGSIKTFANSFGWS
jgi:hypothetical protein